MEVLTVPGHLEGEPVELRRLLRFSHFEKVELGQVDFFQNLEDVSPLIQET